MTGADCDAVYYQRKAREIGLLDGCLTQPLALASVSDAAAVIDGKFRMAAALRAERSLESWAITETARPEVQQWVWGAYRFGFGYQRADLDVKGPPIYESLRDTLGNVGRCETLYTASGMSAIAAILTGLSRVRGRLDVVAARGGYSETRELLESLGERVTLSTPAPSARRRVRTRRQAPVGDRILWLDSATATGFGEPAAWQREKAVLAVLDTTCFGSTSARIGRVVEWSMSAGVPLALVRSHAKLDSLGIEYGRLGSVVLVWRPAEAAHAWMKTLFRAVDESIRLYGTAALPAHFPPFTGTDAYRALSVARTAALIRSTRRMARRLAMRFDTARSLRMFPHGLYFTLAPGGELRLKDVKRVAQALCDAIAGQGLPVKHAGSFGFDFVAVEWFFDALLRRNVLRIAGGDLPPSTIDAIADAIAEWWTPHRIARPDASAAATRQPAPLP